METHKIACDECEADLTYTSNCEGYYLVLGSASKAHYPGGGVVTMMGAYPPVKRTHHFCGLLCMDQWRDRQRHQDGLWRAWNEKWKEQHGTRDETGRVRSYPCAPDDVRKVNEAEFEAAALVAFPRRENRRG